MDVFIIETKETRTLGTYSASYTSALDLATAYGAICDDNAFKWDRDICAYRCTQDTYDWWCETLSEIEDAERRANDLKDIYGTDEVDEVVREAVEYEGDLDHYAVAIHHALDAAFGARVQ